MATEIANIVLIDLGLKAQLSLVVEEHPGSLQLDDVALLACEVKDRE